MLRRCYKLSKSIHKIIGLICLVWFILVGFSGILMNHPDLIRKISVPSAIVPDKFKSTKWNRMAMREMVYSDQDPNRMFACGRMGVWESRDRGKTFLPMDNGYPSSAFDRDTDCLLLTRTHGEEILWAGNRSGLFLWDFASVEWMQIKHKGLMNIRIQDLIQIQNNIFVFTSNDCVVLDKNRPDQKPLPASLQLVSKTDKTVSMIRFMLRIHDGTLLGLPGKLFVDGMGILLIFLCGSAILIWYIPRQRRQKSKKQLSTRLFRILHRYHLKAGIYTVVFLVIIAITGMIIRPPFRQIIVNKAVSAAWMKQVSSQRYPGIRKAVYLEKENRLLLATRLGFFMGPVDFSEPFRKIDIPISVSGMGVTILELLKEDRLLVGSFAGLFVQNRISGTVEAVGRINEQTPPSRTKAVGAAVEKRELKFWVDYNNGIAGTNADDPVPRMPAVSGQKKAMALWQYLRLIHTGNIFRGWLKHHTWLINFLGGALLCISLLTGGYDWFYRRKKRFGNIKFLSRTP